MKIGEIGKQVRFVAAPLCSGVPYLLGHVAEGGRATATEDTPVFGARFVPRSPFVTVQLPGLPDEQVNWILGIRRAVILQELIVRHRVANLRQGP